MMTERESGYPRHYATAIRALLRYALVLLVVGLLSGVAYQESVKKINLTPGPDWESLDAPYFVPAGLVEGVVLGVLVRWLAKSPGHHEHTGSQQQ
jgi:hypothetical protein